ncbi:hypothetical protein [Qipengyuania sp.]|uniref:hypothetical protein n=1 Tax=Qipengyuania sp. TaxID=2004515 RepID=UPI0037353395
MVISPSTTSATVMGAETDFVPSAFRLLNTPLDARPPTACSSCPSAIWFQQDGWRCFCNVMKFLPWQRESTPITACDAREASVARYAEERRKL